MTSAQSLHSPSISAAPAPIDPAPFPPLQLIREELYNLQSDSIRVQFWRTKLLRYRINENRIILEV